STASPAVATGRSARAGRVVGHTLAARTCDARHRGTAVRYARPLICRVGTVTATLPCQRFGGGWPLETDERVTVGGQDMEGSGGVNGDASAKPEVTVEAGPEPTQPEPVEPRTEPSADGTPTSGTPATTETLAGAAAPETTAVQTPAVDPTAAAPATA